MYLNFEELNEAVLSLNDDEVERILVIASSLPVTSFREPTAGTVMMALVDTFDTPFYIGEILVTEAEVREGDVTGYGMIPGHDEKRAFIRAILSLLEQSKSHDVVKERIRVILTGAWKRAQRERFQNESLIASTRVKFDILPGR